MCYSRIKTETALANLVVSGGCKSEFSASEVQRFIQLLADTLPGYVSSDFSIRRIRDCADEYPKLFKLSSRDGEVVISAAEKKPNLHFFNMNYSTELSEHIQNMAITFYAEV